MPDTYKKKYSSFSAKIILCCLLACFFLLLNGSITCKAETKTYTNKSTGYQVIVEDDANLLTDEEETTLGKEMAPITTYGSVAFKSIDYNPYYSTEDYIRSYYRDTFGSTSATVFLIDMDNRNIWIHSNGTIYETITKSYANTITDNVYKYASDGDYYTCAFTAFGQINTLLEGRKIAQPMKYISNAFLAVIIALLLNYFLVRSFSRAKRPSKTDLLGKVFTQCNIANPNVRFIRQSRVYSPPSSSGSGGSSGGGGGHHVSSSGASHGGGGHAELLLQSLDQLGQLEDGQSLHFFNHSQNFLRSHGKLPPYHLKLSDGPFQAAAVSRPLSVPGSDPGPRRNCG